MLRLIAFAMIVFALGAGLAAADNPPPPVLAAQEVTTAPAIDGVLDDACWQGLPEYSDFYDETTKALAKLVTIVKICHDKKYVYVAFHAVCPDPKKIPVHEKKRNGRTYLDDCVYIHLDSSHLHREWSHFGANSIGTQFDYIEGGSINKIQWRGDWSAAARVVDDGYDVEMAIPFSLLKYKKGQDTFGLCFERWDPRQKAWLGWPNLHGEWDGHNFADWTGVHAPYIAPRPVGMSYITGASGGGSDSKTRSGLDIKYPFAPDRLGQISIKPDLGFIEQDVESVDFSYTERLLGENRPFFREWDLGSPPPMFYSRRIEEFDVGGKLVSRGGTNNFQLLNTRGGTDQSDTIVRYVRQLGSRSNVGYGMADRQTSGHQNTVQFLDEWLGWKKGRRYHRIGGSNYFSHTTGVPDELKPVGWKADGWNNDFQYYTNGGNGDMGGTIRWARVDSNYNGELGLTPEKNIQGWGWGPNWGKEYRDRKIRYLNCDFSMERFAHTNGGFYKNGYGINANGGFKGGSGFWTHFGKSDREGFVSSNRVIFHDSEMNFGYYWNGDLQDMNGSMGATIGKRAGGDYLQWSISQRFKLHEGFVLGTNYDWSHVDSHNEYASMGRLFIATLNYDLTPEKSIGGRLVRRLGKQNLYLIYRQQVRRGMDAYIIYGEPNADESIGRISIKLVQPIF